MDIFCVAWPNFLTTYSINNKDWNRYTSTIPGKVVCLTTYSINNKDWNQ